MSIPDLVKATMKEQRQAEGSVTDQAVWWAPAKWATPRLERAVRRVADQTESSLSERGLITRQHVFDLVASESDPLIGFTAAMIWGHGINGYGPHRVEKMVDDAGDGLREKLDGIAAAGREGAAAAWDAFTSSSKIRGLGPAFASKYAYFAAFANGTATSELPTLIVDLNTSWAMWDLVQLPRSVDRRAGYVEYVRRSASWARSARVRPDTIEWALFRIGQSVPRSKRG